MYRVLSYLIAPFSMLIFSSGPSIEALRDRRMVNTFKETVTRLCEGNHVVIFSDHDQPHNQILYNFQDGPVSVARSYYRQTDREVGVVLIYITPSLKMMV